MKKRKLLFGLVACSLLTSVVTSFDGNTIIDKTNIKTALKEEEGEIVTWDLSKESYSSATTSIITWENTLVTMTNEQNGGTAVNNYIPATRTSTRFYNKNILKLTPTEGNKITEVIFTATSEGYATALKNSTWSNATSAVSSSTVTITPTDGTKAISATIGATCGFTSVQVTLASTVNIPHEGFESLSTTSSLKFSYENTQTTYEFNSNSFIKVANVEELEVGDEIVFVSEQHSAALGSEQSNNYSKVDVSISSNSFPLVDDLSVLTLGKDGNYFTFQTSDSTYLYAASSSNNYLRAKTTLDDNCKWSISITSGNATIISQGDSTHNTLRYNNSSKIFSCYLPNNTQQDVQIFKKEQTTNIINSDFNITNVGLRFRIQIPAATVYTDLSVFNPTYGVAFYLGGETEEATATIHEEECEPKAVDSYMQYALVINNIPYTAWEQEITAKAYVQINGKEYYAQSKTYSVKSIAEDYINNHKEDEAVKAHADVLSFLATFNDK